jgi:hypothetical protein
VSCTTLISPRDPELAPRISIHSALCIELRAMKHNKAAAVALLKFSVVPSQPCCFITSHAAPRSSG